MESLASCSANANPAPAICYTIVGWLQSFWVSHLHNDADLNGRVVGNEYYRLTVCVSVNVRHYIVLFLALSCVALVMFSYLTALPIHTMCPSLLDTNTHLETNN